MGKRNRSVRFFGASSRFLAAASGIAVLAAIGSAAAQGNETRRYDIPAQPLSSALFELTKTANLTIVAPPPLLDGKQAPAITGDMSLSDALGQMLTGSGLEFELEDNGRSQGGTLILRRTAAREGAANYVQPSHLQLAQIATNPQRQTGADGSSDMQLASADLDDGGDEELMMEEMVVTGTNIRGSGAVGSDVFVLDRSEIDRSGFGTTQQVIQSLPQNFGGGPNEDTRLGRDAVSNIGFGTGVNLRGLGAGSTLVLVNGRRQSGAGTEGSFTDVSSIPLTAIERIEILPDGASAIYGTDAIGGVVNIILREDYKGAETRLRFGTVSDGEVQEYQAGQVFGTSWDDGHALLSYEYYRRDRLASDQRSFTSNGDLSPFGGDNFNTPFSNPGNILNPFTFEPAFAIPRGQDGTALTPGDLIDLSANPDAVNLQNQNEERDVLPDQERHSVFVSVSQSVGDRVELFAEGRYSQRDFALKNGTVALPFLFVPASNPFFVDPFGFGFTLVNYTSIDDLGPASLVGDVQSYNGVFGGTIAPSEEWQVTLSGSYGREETDQRQNNVPDFVALSAALADDDPTTAFNPFGDGSNTNPATLETIRSTQRQTRTSDIWTANVIADGPLFALPGGDVKIAVGADYRREILGVGPVNTTRFDRDVIAVFGELFVPLIGGGNAKPGLERLEVSVAGRFEDYDDFGSTANPKVGASWSPMEGLTVRGTFGTSFKAPALRDLDDVGPSNLAFQLPLLDPTAPLGTTLSVVRSGNNSELVEERATTWTAGFDFAPRAVPGLEFDLTYFSVDFEDRIASLEAEADILLQEDRFGPFINRNPSQEELDAVCGNDRFFGDPSLCVVGVTGAIIDSRLSNTSETRVNGLDFNAIYDIDTRFGRLGFRLNGSIYFDFQEKFTSTAPTIELIDTISNPVDFRMRNSVSWSHNGFGAIAFFNYTDNYTDNLSDPERRIDSWTTVDVQLSYRTEDRYSGSWLNGIAVSLSILNLFDNDPPFANNPIGVAYDPENADPLNRFIAFQITKEW